MDILYYPNYSTVQLNILHGKSDIREPDKIDENKLNVAFESGYDGLNETNKNIINSTIAGLLAKQELEEKEENKGGK